MNSKSPKDNSLVLTASVLDEQFPHSCSGSSLLECSGSVSLNLILLFVMGQLPTPGCGWEGASKAIDSFSLCLVESWITLFRNESVGILSYSLKRKSLWLYKLTESGLALVPVCLWGPRIIPNFSSLSKDHNLFFRGSCSWKSKHNSHFISLCFPNWRCLSVIYGRRRVFSNSLIPSLLRL